MVTANKMANSEDENIIFEYFIIFPIDDHNITDVGKMSHTMASFNFRLPQTMRYFTKGKH